MRNEKQIPYHWSHDIVGAPYELGARGPDKFDCWGVVYFKYKTIDGIDIGTYPDLAYKNASKLIGQSVQSNWIHIEKPVDGCAVFLAKGMIYTHVGIFCDVDGGILVHAIEGDHVSAMSIHHLSIRGWLKRKYYIHKEQVK
jgi:cell wall-associated NlpC family hydrolase